MRKHARIIIPAALLAVFLLGGWTLRNKLAADRQGDWVRATRGDLVTGFEVIGTLASSVGDLGPRGGGLWNFNISRWRAGDEVRRVPGWRSTRRAPPAVRMRRAPGR